MGRFRETPRIAGLFVMGIFTQGGEKRAPHGAPTLTVPQNDS